MGPSSSLDIIKALGMERDRKQNSSAYHETKQQAEGTVFVPACQCNSTKSLAVRPAALQKDTLTKQDRAHEPPTPLA